MERRWRYKRAAEVAAAARRAVWVLPGLIFAVSAPIAAGEQPMNIGTQKQLLIDDYVIESMQPGLFRIVNQPAKYPDNPVIGIDQPWEQPGGLSYGGDQGTIMYDSEDGLYKFWSMMVNWDWSRDWLAYAYSADGINWVKPKLGIAEYKGHETNFVGEQGMWTQAGILKDPAAVEAEERYKMVYYGSEKEGHAADLKGMCIAHSPDGIHWTPYADEYQPIWPFFSDTSNNLLWDTRRERYIYYLRLFPTLERWFEPEPVYKGTPRARTPGRAVSRDFLHWDAPASKTDPAEEYVCLHARREDPILSRDFYTLSVLPYAGGYIGLTAVYHTPQHITGRFGMLPAGMDGGNANNPWVDRIDVQLAWSRDGEKFRRFSEPPFIPNGPEGSPDDDLIYPMQFPIVREDIGEIWIYYQGFGGRHSFQRRGEEQKGQICLAKLRLDGFVSITGVGTLTTKPISFEGDRLRINATGVDRYAGANWGSVTVEIIDAETGAPLPAFSEQECDAFGGDAVDHVVTWEGRENVGELAGRGIKVRFHVDQAKLFSFRFSRS